MNEDEKKVKIIVNAGYQLVKDGKISNGILETIIQSFATQEELRRRSNEEYMKVKSRQAPNRNTWYFLTENKKHRLGAETGFKPRSIRNKKPHFRSIMLSIFRRLLTEV